MIQTIKAAIQSNKDITSLTREVCKEAKKTVELVKTNGYALDKIKVPQADSKK